MEVSGERNTAAILPLGEESPVRNGQAGQAPEQVQKLWIRKESHSPAWNDTRIPLLFSLQPSHYTDWAIPHRDLFKLQKHH